MCVWLENSQAKDRTGEQETTHMEQVGECLHRVCLRGLQPFSMLSFKKCNRM